MLNTITIHSTLFSYLEEMEHVASFVREPGSCLSTNSEEVGFLLHHAGGGPFPRPSSSCPALFVLRLRGHKSQGRGGWEDRNVPTLLLLLPTKGRSLPYPLLKVFPHLQGAFQSFFHAWSAGTRARMFVQDLPFTTRNNLSLPGLKNEGVGPTNLSARLYLSVLWQQRKCGSVAQHFTTSIYTKHLYLFVKWENLSLLLS